MDAQARLRGEEWARSVETCDERSETRWYATLDLLPARPNFMVGFGSKRRQLGVTLSDSHLRCQEVLDPAAYANLPTLVHAARGEDVDVWQFSARKRGPPWPPRV